MKTQESATTLRLSAEAKRLLRLLATSSGISMTAILEIMIRAEAKRQRLGRQYADIPSRA